MNEFEKNFQAWAEHYAKVQEAKPRYEKIKDEDPLLWEYIQHLLYKANNNGFHEGRNYDPPG